MNAAQMTPRAGEDVNLRRYQWTIAYIAVVITLVLILEILNAMGKF